MALLGAAWSRPARRRARLLFQGVQLTPDGTTHSALKRIAPFGKLLHLVPQCNDRSVELISNVPRVQVKVNNRIRCLDKVRMPGGREKRFLLFQKASVIGDIGKAHKRFKYNEHGFLACMVHGVRG